jgi:hypothetical protein
MKYKTVLLLIFSTSIVLGGTNQSPPSLWSSTPEIASSLIRLKVYDFIYSPSSTQIPLQKEEKLADSNVENSNKMKLLVSTLSTQYY